MADQSHRSFKYFLYCKDEHGGNHSDQKLALQNSYQQHD